MEQFDHAKSLTGIGFEIYNVSAKFWQAYDEALGTNKTPTTEEPKTAIKTASNSIERKYQNGQVPRTGLIDQERNTDINGQVSFTVPFKLNKQYQVYLFLETSVPSNINEKADLMIVVLPIQNPETNTLLTDIQLYPKNSIKEEFNK